MLPEQEVRRDLSNVDNSKVDNIPAIPPFKRCCSFLLGRVFFPSSVLVSRGNLTRDADGNKLDRGSNPPLFSKRNVLTGVGLLA